MEDLPVLIWLWRLQVLQRRAASQGVVGVRAGAAAIGPISP